MEKGARVALLRAAEARLLGAAIAAEETIFDAVRRREFKRLDGHTYLDYTGSALYAESQIRAHQRMLAEGIFGNPHSESPSSRWSSRAIAEARETVLQFFDVDASTHDVVFTANTTAAIKLVAESYPFTADNALVLAVDNHNSINGIREYARRAGAQIRYLPLDAELRLRDPGAVLDRCSSGLLAFAGQSNFSGVRHPLDLAEIAHGRGLDVLIDIAALAPSHPISLRSCAADFAALSFYKLFGYPTGLGALIARREALARLRRPWFAGGTVNYASIKADAFQFRGRYEAFEDGTPNFLGIAALPAGFALLAEVGMTNLSCHVARLTKMFLDELLMMPRVVVYGPKTIVRRGGIVTFNVRDKPYWEVEKRASDAGISLRGGCFCNPGASEVAFGLDGLRIAECFQEMAGEFSVERFASCADTAVGAVRVSFGLANNAEDVRRALAFIATL